MMAISLTPLIFLALLNQMCLVDRIKVAKRALTRQKLNVWHEPGSGAGAIRRHRQSRERERARSG
jgi:hypothetical protein